MEESPLRISLEVAVSYENTPTLFIFETQSNYSLIIKALQSIKDRKINLLPLLDKMVLIDELERKGTSIAALVGKTTLENLDEVQRNLELNLTAHTIPPDTYTITTHTYDPEKTIPEFLKEIGF